MLDPADGDRLLAELIDRYPSLRQHLASARRVGEWQVRAPAQHFHHEPLGRRHLLFDEGAASNDLLFSRKLSNAGELVLALAHRLIDAARQGDYQSTALQAFVGIQNSIVHLNDRITWEPILLSAIRISERLRSCLAAAIDRCHHHRPQDQRCLRPDPGSARLRRDRPGHRRRFLDAALPGLQGHPELRTGTLP